MAEQLIRLSRGRLEIASGLAASRDADPGLAFSARVTLPLAEQAIVLVIDDNADTLQLFQRYLSGGRYRFVGAQNAEEGLALAEGFAPHVIVLDVLMPEQDGWTVLGRFREHPKTRDVPIIVSTILPQEHLALTLGAAEFIRKPVNRTTLLAALERQLDRPARADG
jgi:CheY-like chemotaxis protein